MIMIDSCRTVHKMSKLPHTYIQSDGEGIKKQQTISHEPCRPCTEQGLVVDWWCCRTCAGTSGLSWSARRAGQWSSRDTGRGPGSGCAYLWALVAPRWTKKPTHEYNESFVVILILKTKNTSLELSRIHFARPRSTALNKRSWGCKY